jgi:hypothetical protein
MRLNAVIDRLENDKAVLLVGEDETAVAWPRSCLPGGAREGDILAVTLTADPEATRQARAEAAELLRQLTDKNK